LSSNNHYKTVSDDNMASIQSNSNGDMTSTKKIYILEGQVSLDGKQDVDVLGENIVTTTNSHNSHVNPFTVTTGLIWSVATVAMRHSSNGRPQHHRHMKLVATGEK
jgi:hypothetical protein